MREKGEGYREEEEHENVLTLSKAELERIFVSIRVRPLNEKERARCDVPEWECISSNTIRFSGIPEPRAPSNDSYTFDRVFGERCSTQIVYEQGIKEVALSVVSGINSSIFAYGQTSSGKTYTMTGITNYAIRDIYDYIEKHKEREFAVKFSAMEIYNEAVRDLLSAQVTPLRVLDDPEKGTVVEKLTEETLKDKNQLQQLLYTCAAERTTEETAMNETSSRSHQILRLTVESNPNDYVRTARSGTLIASVNFVDLAGSERASQAMSAGTRLREGSHINRSLLTLGTVIRKLSKERNGHIPYRDSKLTRILHNSLGGNARTAIICTISPARSQVEQSRNTLFFAGCAKQVATNAKVNVMISDKVLVKQLQKELARMENELRNFNPHSTILKERELQIEQMDKQIKELTRQRDLFQSHIENLLHSAAEDRLMKVDKDSASELSSVGAASYLGLGTDNTSENLYRTTSSVSISNDQLLQEHENSEEDFLLDGSPPMFVGPDPCQGWEEIASRAESEDNFKEVPCNEKKEAETDVDASIPVFEEEEEEGGGGGGNTPMKQVVSVDAINKSSSRNGYDELSHVALDNSQDTQQQRNQDLHADLSEKSFGSSESESHILTVMSPPQTDKVDQETASHPQFIKLDNSQVARQQKYQDFRLECSEKSNKSFESESDILAVMSPPQTDKVDQETATHPQFIKLDNSQDAQQQKYQDFRLERSEKSNASCESESHILAAMSPPQTDEVDQETATHPQFIKLDNSQDAQQEKYQDFCLERSEKSNASCESESHILAAMSPQTDKVDQETASQPQFTKLDNNKDTLQQKYQDFRLERSEKPDKSFESESHILAAMSPPQTDKVDQEIVSHPQFTKLDNSQDALQQNNQDFRLERSEKSNASFESEPRNPPSRSSRGRSSWPILAAMFPPQTYKVDQKTSSRPHFTKLDHKVVSPSQFNKLDQEPATPHFDEQELKTMSPPQSYESSPHFHEQEVKTMLPPQSDQAPQHFDEQEVETVVPSQSDDSLPHFHEQDPKTMLASQSEESPPHFDEQEQKTMLSPQSDQASPYFDEPEFRTMLTPQSDQAPPRFDEPEFKTKLPPQSHEAPPHFDEQELKARSPPQSDQALPYFDEQGLKTMLAPQSGKFEQASVKEHSTSLVGFHEELSEPKLHAKKRKSPRKYSLVKEMDDTSAEEESVMDSDSEETASVLNFVITMNERAKPTPLKNDFEDLMVRAKTRESHKRLNRVKGISFQAAPSKFERRQRDIIELWNRCNVPLVHRSYFFLLIKGELSDSVYLDVEFRRLSFLKDTFSRGTSITGEVGVDVTPNSSMKALNRERKMLSKQVHKKFSKKEREELYQKWCIDLKTKHRSIQLAWLLWTNIKDMNHVRESATLVAKLVGFIDSGEAPKKVFGLSFLSRLKSKKSNDWKDTMSVV